MNRRSFFKAAPAMLVAPVVPTVPKAENVVVGTIAIHNGKEYLPIVAASPLKKDTWYQMGVSFKLPNG